MKKLTLEYRYRRYASWFARKASRLAAARVAHEVVAHEGRPYRIWQ